MSNESPLPYLRVQPVTPDIVVVHLTVRNLTDDVNLEQLGQELFAMVEQQGCRRLVVNLEAVRIVQAAAMGKMIVLHRKMHRQHGRVLFCHLHPCVEDVLRASHLNTYLQIVPDINHALATLSQAWRPARQLAEHSERAVHDLCDSFTSRTWTMVLRRAAERALAERALAEPALA